MTAVMAAAVVVTVVTGFDYVKEAMRIRREGQAAEQGRGAAPPAAPDADRIRITSPRIAEDGARMARSGSHLPAIPRWRGRKGLGPWAASALERVLGTWRARCLDALRARGESLATAESLTAGLVSATIAAVPGASDVLRGGLTSYATDVKVSQLGVDAATIARHSVISAEVAEQMAVGARALFGSDWAVSATGVAGPDSQDGHPVGEVYVAVAAARLTRIRGLQLAGDRAAIRQQAVDAALALLEARLAAE